MGFMYMLAATLVVRGERERGEGEGEGKGRGKINDGREGVNVRSRLLRGDGGGITNNYFQA